MKNLSLTIVFFFSIIIPQYVSIGQSISDNIPRFMVWDNEHNLNDERSDDEIETYLVKLKSHNIRGIFLGAKNETYKRVIPIAKQVGIEIHAWRRTMINTDEKIMQSHKEWYAYNKNNESCIDKPPYVGYYRWLCPNEPEVIDFLVNEYLQLANIEDINGVHLDYIRYCDIFLPIGLQGNYNLVQDHEMPEFDYCYCPRCREGFKKEFGIDPIEIKDSTQQQLWLEWRLKSIVNVANTITKVVKEKTGKLVTAAVFPTPQMSVNMVRQDWSKFELDAVCPMLYNGFYNESINWIGNCVKEGIETMEYKKSLYAGLMVQNIKENKSFKTAIETAFDNGANGVVFFSAVNLTDEHLDILKNFSK